MIRIRSNKYISNKHIDIFKRFYDSAAWRRVSAYVRVARHGICADCGKAGWEVHHIVPLTPKNINDPGVALNPDNLELLCTSCHNAKRGGGNKYIRSDLRFTSNGDVVLKQPPRSKK